MEAKIKGRKRRVSNARLNSFYPNFMKAKHILSVATTNFGPEGQPDICAEKYIK
jgi:hypothetical protein